jgi:hypothetical protein
MSKRKNAKRKIRDDRMTPTPELHQHGVIELPEITQKRAQLAAKRIPPLETMWRAGKLSDAHYLALDFYRTQALTAEHSSTRDSLNFEVRVQTFGHIPAVVLSARIETGRMEKDLGSLRDIARAVARDDKSLSQWCIDQHGGREKYDGTGKFLAIVPCREKEVMEGAWIDLRFAAARITR